MPAWTTPSDIKARVRRRWDDGSLLRALVTGEPFPVIDLPLKRPKPSEVGADLEAVRSWVASIESGATKNRYTVDHTSVGGRVVGRNELPDRVRVTTFEQAWALLGVTEEVTAFTQVFEATAPEPDIQEWVSNQPLQALRVSEDWNCVLAAYRWLLTARGSGRHLREVTAPGVDTKFIERNRPLLARLLDVPGSASGFVQALGLAAKPERVRLRCPGLLAGGITEATLRLDELRDMDLAVDRALILENEVTFLSAPVPAQGVVIWGKGFEVHHAGSLPWLRNAEVTYWGDLDTHGFAILHQLRAWLPQTRSVLMDRDTLLAHRARWVREASPTMARLDRLTSDEAGLYADLVSDSLGDRVRLEQERIDWSWALEQLARARPAT